MKDDNTTHKERLFDFFLLFLDVAEIDIRNSSNFERDFQKRLKFQKNTDWKKFRASIDLLEDTELAIRSAFTYQLGDLANNNDDYGEPYLRLYGILNAVYLQMSAYEEISTLTNYKSREEIQKYFRSLDIYKLRGMAGAHTLDYKFDKDLPKGIKKTSFRIIQESIKKEAKRIQVLDENDIEFEFNLIEILLEYEKKSTTLLLDLIKYSIERFLIKKERKLEFQKDLERLSKNLIDYSKIDKNQNYWKELVKEIDKQFKKYK